MSAALILYGSRARGESRQDSDVDMIFAEEGALIGSPKNFHGISVHLYSKHWLESESNSGSLFLYHVAFEGIALHDPDEFLIKLQKSFKMKNSYEK